ncbi:MAG: hypothetical protein IPK70_01570 [Flavobacteriales bacterium]|nr:hypothetical protein [Flavobacteriales bacterium]
MKLTISIPTPCHEDWSAMTPQATGRHCAICATTVADFSRLSDAQLIARFEQGGMPKCARFSKDQLDRVLSKPEEPAPNLLAAAATGAALMLVSPELAAQQEREISFGQPVIQQPVPVEALMRGVVETRETARTEEAEPMLAGGAAFRAVRPDGSWYHYIDEVRVDGPLPPQEDITIRGGMAVIEVVEDEGNRASNSDSAVMNSVRKLSPKDIAPLPVRSSDATGITCSPNAPSSAKDQVRVITGGLPVHYGDVPWTITDVSTVRGRVIDAQGEPLPYAHLVWSDGEHAGATGFDGRFTVRRTPPHREHAMRVLFVGHEPQEVPLPISQACHGESIVGDAVDAQGKPLAGVAVSIESLGLSCTTDELGRFAFDVPQTGMPDRIELQAVGLAGNGAHAIIESGSLPQCLQLVLGGERKQARVLPKDIDLGDIVMNSGTFFMGEVVLIESTASKVKRGITRPFRWLGRQIAKPFH